MTWFKVDDGFCMHPKVVGLDMSARGLWVTAGSWCAQQLTDGVIDDRQIRTLGGTRKQAEKLVAAGLWSHDGAAPSARRFFFEDWRDFQPTRDEVLSKRQRARERMAEARAKKAPTSDDEKMFARTNSERSQNVRVDRISERSPYPDPTRPDPSLSMVTVSKQATSSTARDEWAAAKNIPIELHSAANRALANGHPEQAILLAAQEWQTRPGHKTPGLLDPLIRDAETRLEAEAGQQRKHDQAQARRDAIANCDMCDPNGYILGLDDAVRCRHDYTANDALMRRLELGEQPGTVKGPF